MIVVNRVTHDPIIYLRDQNGYPPITKFTPLMVGILEN